MIIVTGDDGLLALSPGEVCMRVVGEGRGVYLYHLILQDPEETKASHRGGKKKAGGGADLLGKGDRGKVGGK